MRSCESDLDGICFVKMKMGFCIRDVIDWRRLVGPLVMKADEGWRGVLAWVEDDGVLGTQVAWWLVRVQRR